MPTNPKHDAAPTGRRERSKKRPTRAQALSAYRYSKECEPDVDAIVRKHLASFDHAFDARRSYPKEGALTMDASESSYEIDAIVRAQIASGMLGGLGDPILKSIQSRIASPSTEYERSEYGRNEMTAKARYLGNQPIAMARYIFNQAAERAWYLSQDELIQRPRAIQAIEVLVKDLEYLHKRFLPRVRNNTNKALFGASCMEERESGQRIIDRNRFGRDLKNLRLALDMLTSQAAGFLQTFKMASRTGGNRDPFVRTFISVVGRNLGIVTSERPMIKENVRPLANLLAAGWRDLGFPTKDHRGKSREPLGEWFEDRIRKQFKL
jgi:hypothetical protein